MRKNKKVKKMDYDFSVCTDNLKDEIIVFLLGQPNVGKSSLLNAFVGTKIEVSNFPGTSVEITSAEKIFTIFNKKDNTTKEVKYIFKDTPGIYSISDRSVEETITKKAILTEKSDVVILIANAAALGRSLYFALQVMEAGKNIIIGLNFFEEAYKKGISVNTKKLSQVLEVQVVPFNPITGNIDNLIITASEKACNPNIKNYCTEYDDHIEELISFIERNVKDKLPARFVALRILEEDDDFTGQINDHVKNELEERKEEISDKHQNIKEDISKIRYGTASFITEQTTHITPLKKTRINEVSFADKFLLHKIGGPILTIIFFVCLFSILIFAGQAIQELFLWIGNWFINLIPENYWQVGSFSFLNLFRDGIAGLFAGVAIALPYVLIFYLILGFTEDVGLLPRFVVIIQRFFDSIGLPSKSFISIMLGLGCTVPAHSSTRIINRRKDRLKTAFLFSFIPCSSRIGIILGIVGFYGSIWLALLIFFVEFISLLLWAVVLKYVIREDAEPLLIELPPYRKPMLKNVFAKSWLRMKDFVKVVIPLLVIGGILYSILEQLGVTGFFIKPFDNIMGFLFNLEGEFIVPLLFGFIQKDLTSAMLINVLGQTGVQALTNLKLITFGILACTGVPCIIALGMMLKEYKIKEVILIFLGTLIYAIVLASIIAHVGMLFI
jgi:ferrous iron transport protein B